MYYVEQAISLGNAEYHITRFEGVSLAEAEYQFKKLSRLNPEKKFYLESDSPTGKILAISN